MCLNFLHPIYIWRLSNQKTIRNINWMLIFAFCYRYNHQYFHSRSATSVKFTKKKKNNRKAAYCNKQLKTTSNSLFVNCCSYTNTRRMTNEFLFEACTRSLEVLKTYMTVTLRTHCTQDKRCFYTEPRFQFPLLYSDLLLKRDWTMQTFLQTLAEDGHLSSAFSSEPLKWRTN